MRTRIMYIECKAGGLICRATRVRKPARREATRATRTAFMQRARLPRLS